MFDTMLRPAVDNHLNKIAAKLGEIGIGPNQITLYGFVIGFVGCVAIGLQNYMLGLFLILLNRLADGLDGAVFYDCSPHPTVASHLEPCLGHFPLFHDGSSLLAFLKQAVFFLLRLLGGLILFDLFGLFQLGCRACLLQPLLPSDADVRGTKDPSRS